MHQYERHRAAPLRGRIESVLLPRAQARAVTGLHAATWRRSLMIDTAGNFAANFATQGKALAVGGEAQMRYALRIVGDVFTQQILAREDFVVGVDLYPEAEALSSITRQVRATSATTLTIVVRGHAQLSIGRRCRRSTSPRLFAHRSNIAAVDAQRSAIRKPRRLPRWKAIGERQQHGVARETLNNRQ